MRRVEQTDDILAIIRAAAEEGVTRLSLRGRGLTALPAEIGRLTALEQLSLADNALESLPPEIGRLANLTHLNLRNNQLKSLPVEITQLERLQMLQLTGNPLTIPPDIVAKWDRPDEILDYYRRHLVPDREQSEEPSLDPSSLHWIMSVEFSEEELRVLCEEICIDYEALGGRDKEERVRALIAFHEFHGMGEEFRALIQALRPRAFG